MGSEKEKSAETVIVVDDLMSTRLLVVDMLKEMGFSSILEAADGPEALLKAHQGKPSLIVCDYVMKGMSGVDLVRELRKDPVFKDLKVIMLSNNRDVPLIDTAIDAGADDYIVKPVSFHILKRRIEDVLTRGTPSAGDAS